MSLVSQEPTLYAGTVRFNILLGAIKPAEEVTQAEIEEVCRKANILEFVQSLPELVVLIFYILLWSLNYRKLAALTPKLAVKAHNCLVDKNVRMRLLDWYHFC